MSELQRAMARAMTEDELQAAIYQAAGLFGWSRHHDRGDLRGRLQGDVGFPDLVLARRGRVLFLELKSETGQLSEGQLAWQLQLGANRSALADYRLVRPTDLDDVLAALR